MLARCQGELLDQSKLAATLGINGQTVGRYKTCSATSCWYAVCQAGAATWASF